VTLFRAKGMHRNALGNRCSRTGTDPGEVQWFLSFTVGRARVAGRGGTPTMSCLEIFQEQKQLQQPSAMEAYIVYLMTPMKFSK
jgi:hypothetical protein